MHVLLAHNYDPLQDIQQVQVASRQPGSQAVRLGRPGRAVWLSQQDDADDANVRELSLPVACLWPDTVAECHHPGHRPQAPRSV